jgi:hypothetical protein
MTCIEMKIAVDEKKKKRKGRQIDEAGPDWRPIHRVYKAPVIP